METSREEFVNQSELLEMGWTKSLIQQFLPEPILKPNPYYRSGPPMKKWNRDVVLEVMGQDDFKVALEKTDKRKKAAAKAVKTKEENLEALAEDFAKSINIKLIEDDEVLQKNAKYNAYHQYLEHKKEFEYQRAFADFTSVDEDTINRWVVNYIRHSLTQYDKNLLKFVGKVGKDNAYCTFRNLLLTRIAEIYPKYAETCRLQMIDDSLEL